MWRSIRTTSGCRSSAREIASSPLAASPASVTPSTEPSRPRGRAEGVGVVGDEDAQLLGSHADDRTPGRGPGEPPRHHFPVRSGHGPCPPGSVGWRLAGVHTTTGGPDAASAPPVPPLCSPSCSGCWRRSSCSLQRLGAGPRYPHAHVQGLERGSTFTHIEHQGRQAAVEPAGRRHRIHQPARRLLRQARRQQTPSAARRPPAPQLPQVDVTCVGVMTLADGTYAAGEHQPARAPLPAP